MGLIQIFAQQLRQGGFLRFLQGFQQGGLFLLQVCNPAFQVAHHLTDRLHEPVGGGNVPVQVADVGLYPSFLHLGDRWPHVDGGDFIKPLPFIGTKVKAFRAVIGFQIAVGDSRPALPPYLSVLLVIPVHGVLLVAFPVAGREPDTLAVLVKVINLPALGKPFPGFVHCPHGKKDVGVGISVPLVMDGKVGNHAFGNKKLPAVVPDKVGVLFRGKFPRYGKHEPPGKLGVPLLLDGFGSVPQGIPVCVLWRGMGRQHDFSVDDPSFLGIVFLLLVVLGKQPFAALVSCGGYG